MPTHSRFDAELQARFLEQLAALRPAFLWTFAGAGRRRCLHVPAQLVTMVRQGLENGRRLEARLAAPGTARLRAWRQQRDAHTQKD